MKLKKGGRVKTFGLSLNCTEWCSDGTAKLIKPADGYDRNGVPIPEPRLFLKGGGDEAVSVEGPFYRWRVRFVDDGQISERWVRESDLIS